MKKKILFIAPDFYGFNEVILAGLKEYSNHDVTMAVSASTKIYRYRNFNERFVNFLSKTFLNRNLKNIQKRKNFIYEINTHHVYDTIIVNRPDILDSEVYDLIQKKQGKRIVVFWDSFEKISGQKETLHYYDIKYSFDSENCKDFGLKKINNFYFNENFYTGNPVYDVVFLGTFDKRYDDLVKIIKSLKNNNINIHTFIYHPKDFLVENEIIKNITKLPNIIPFNESYKINKKGNIILDLAHENQSGLSFRPFEALGSKKKLITTNKNIKNYDFYDPNNIFVIEDTDNIKIPPDFFKTPYKNINQEIINKYSLKSWIKNILDYE